MELHDFACVSTSAVSVLFASDSVCVWAANCARVSNLRHKERVAGLLVGQLYYYVDDFDLEKSREDDEGIQIALKYFGE